MNPITSAVKTHLDLSANIPLKIALYQALRKTIILREIPAGARINEKEIALELNISRTPIRYALQELVKEKLVEHIPQKGIVVKGISQEDAYEIFAIRKALDTLATINAMYKMTPEDFDEMKALLLEGEAHSKAGNIDAVIKNFSDFNNLIYGKSQMIRLREIVVELQSYLGYFRRLSISSPQRRDKALEEHWIIYRGMRNKDIDQITLITHEHLNRSLEFILEEMDRMDQANAK